MKKNDTSSFGYKCSKIYGYLGFTLLSIFTVNGFSQQSYTFTNCSATGINGPNQGQVTSAYNLTNLSGAVTINTLGIQEWMVPNSGMYRIETYGAQGGNGGSTGGLGAKMSGEFSLMAGTVLKIVVGQVGGSGQSHGGGGGGSFVTDNNNTPLCIAGGGGGSYDGNYNFLAGNMTGTISGNGQYGVHAYNSTVYGPGGTNGSGGGSNLWNPNDGQGAGGGGLIGNGANGGGAANTGGLSFVNNAIGGIAVANSPGQAGDGGFGGGGGSEYSSWQGGGGGGGYSGGGAGIFFGCGGGGGSFNSGTNQNNASGVRAGDGLVVITSLCDVQLNGVTTICNGSSTTLSTTAISNILWSTGSTANSIILSPQTTTQYTVSGNGSQNNCSSIIVFSVIVNQLPNVSANVSPTLLCIGSTATLTGTGADTYTWSSGPTTTITTVNPIVSTTYTVFGTSAVGCLNNYVVNVNVDNLQLSISGNTAVCLGKSGLLTGSGGTNLSWAGSGPFNPLTITPTVASVYTLTGIDANNCTLTKTVSVIVNPNPVVTASASKTLVCKGQKVILNADGASTYSWSASAGSASTPTVSVAMDIVTTYDYFVVGTDVNGCTGTGNISVRAELCTAINELTNSVSGISVYPNPNNGEFVVRSPAPMQIAIINELGQTVKNITLTETVTEANVDGLANGIYFITGQSNGKNIAKKIVVNK